MDQIHEEAYYHYKDELIKTNNEIEKKTNEKIDEVLDEKQKIIDKMNEKIEKEFEKAFPTPKGVKNSYKVKIEEKEEEVKERIKDKTKTEEKVNERIKDRNKVRKKKKIHLNGETKFRKANEGETLLSINLADDFITWEDLKTESGINQSEEIFKHQFNDENKTDLNNIELNLNINPDLNKENNQIQQIEYFDHLLVNDLDLDLKSDSTKPQDFNDTYYKNFAEFQEMDKFLTKTINSLNNNNENEIDFEHNEKNFKDFEKFFKKSIENAQFFKSNPSRINSESLDDLKNYFHDINKGDIYSPLFSIKDRKIFFYPGCIRCSDLHVKHLKPNAIKNELHNDLKNIKYYLPFSQDSIPKKEGKEGGKIPKVLLDILKTTSDLRKMWQILEPGLSDLEKYDKWFFSKPNHNVIEKFLYNKFPQIVAIETPVWNKPLQIIGHIDFLLFDDKTLYVMDYKPEGANGKEFKFIHSIPQVSMYGKLIKKFVPDDVDVKCVSFCRDSGWIYDPNKIKDVLPSLIKEYMKKPEFFDKLAWIPLANDKSAPFESMAQAKINDYFNSIFKNKSKQPYRKKFRKVLHNLKSSDEIPPEDMTFLGKALQKNFNLIDDNISKYITEYKKNFKTKELYKEFLNNIGKGMLYSECSQDYFSSKYAALDKSSLSRIFHYYKQYAREIINNKNRDRMSLQPYTREIFDNVSKNSKEKLIELDKNWKNDEKGATHVPIEGYPNIASYVFYNMEKGEDLTKMFLKIKKISTKESLPNTIIYFKNRIRKFFNEDRERALNLYKIPISPKKISISVDKKGNVKISEFKNFIPCIYKIEGLSSKKFFIKNLEENKTPKEIIEYLKINIPKNDLPSSYNNFIHQFIDWSKSHREYLLTHFGIPIDVGYQIKQKDDFTVPVEIRIKEFCNKRLNQGVPLETFAKTVLYQVPEPRRKIKWRQICNNINSFARNNPKLFQKHYGIKIDDYFSAAKYLNTHMDIKFKNQKRKFIIPTKYSIEGLPLKNFIQNELENSPKQNINDIFNKILKLYPKNHQEIKTTIGRCAKTWISDHPKHSNCKNVTNSLEKFQSGCKTSNTKMQLLKDILANNTIEQCKQNHAKNTLSEKGTSKAVSEHSLNTTISRMKRIIKHRIANPAATFDELKLIAKKSLSKSALNRILSTTIQDLNKLKIIEKKKTLKELTAPTKKKKKEIDLPKSEQILFQRYIQEKYVKTGMKKSTIAEAKRGILQFYDFLAKNFPKTQEISKISYKQYQQFDTSLKEDLKLSKKAYTNYSNQIRRYLKFNNPEFAKWHSESQLKQKQPFLQNDRKLIEKFINEKFVLPSKSKNSISKANSALKNYAEFIKKQHPDLNSIENAKNSQLNEFKTYLLKNKKYSSETTRKQKRIVQNFLQFNKLLEFQDKITNVKQYITQQIQKQSDLSSIMDKILKQTPAAQKQTKITTCRRYIRNALQKYPEIAKDIYNFENSPNTRIKINTEGEVSIYKHSHK